MSRVVINCEHPDWLDQLHSHLRSGVEVDLFNFEFEIHSKQCEEVAHLYSMEINLDRHPKARALHFRKK